MSESRQRLLWIDDDGEGRYLSEVLFLAHRGWEVVWARDARSAMEILSSEQIAAVLLDQVFPHDSNLSEKEDIWAGCRLLFWLRKAKGPDKAPLSEGWAQLLNEWQPLPENDGVPVLLVSAYQDFRNGEIENTARQASETDSDMKVVRKPVDFGKIQSFLHSTGDE